MRKVKPTFLCLAVVAVLIAAAVTILGLSGPSAVLAQGDEPQQASEELQATPLPDGVDPFAMTFPIYRDSWVDQADPHTNHGVDLELTLRAESGAAAFALLTFDLSTLPADAEVISATLSVYSADTSSDPYPILPYAITTAWVETSVTWDTRPGTSHLGDLPARHVPEGWTVLEVTDIVRAWRDGSQANYGIALRPDVGASGSRTFEARKSARPPELTIYYTRRAELTAVADTWVGYAQPDTPHGTSNTLQVASASDTYSQEAHALLGFDFASLPADVAVISATLSLFSVQNRAASDLDPALGGNLYADAIGGPWDEATTTWNSAPASVYLDDPPTSWVNLWTRWDVTNILQSWAAGDLDPYGILLRVAPESPFGVHFYSRDLANPPTLVIAYGAAPPSCDPITSLDVSGATAGVTGVEYTFDAVYSPPDADPPDNIRWSADDYTEHFYGPSITLSWDSPGEKTIWVAASHCGGTSSTSHTITISEPPSNCDYPIQAVTLSGPMVVAMGTDHQFTAAATPINATLPMTFTWEATGMPPEILLVDDHITNRTYNWPAAGSKTISVTAENCSGSVQAYQSVQVEDPADLPDLRVSTAWIQLSEDRIYYVIHNDGDSAAPPGFFVSFEFQGTTPAVTQHTNPLAPGGVAVGFLEHVWDCSGDFERVGVLADWTDVVVEVDEINNLWQANWDCDQMPPQIVGPEILKLGETTANIHWTTSEPCDGWLEWGTSPADSSPGTVPGDTNSQDHNATLSGLTADTTYFVRAFCTDAAGLTSNTGAVAFETPAPGTDPPRLHGLTLQRYPSTMYDFWELILEMEDDPYMDRVMFAMDGYLVGLDYSPDTDGPTSIYRAYLSPAEMGLSRADFFQSHEFAATAFRQDPTAIGELIEHLTPAETDPEVSVDILEPHNLHKIYVATDAVPEGTLLDVLVRAAAFDWHCTWGAYTEGVVPPGLEGVDCDDLIQREVESVALWIDGTRVYQTTPAPGELFFDLQAPIGGLGLGSHQIEVLAQASGVSATAQRTFTVEQGQPGLEVTRSIRREGNTLQVTLDLHNSGTFEAIVVALVDDVYALQPILGQRDLPDVSYEVDISDIVWSSYSARRELDLLISFVVPQPDGPYALVLAPGEGTSVTYTLVPELHESEFPARIGRDPLQVWMQDSQGQFYGETFDLSDTLVDDPSYGIVPLDTAVAHAFREADYLLVTAPQKIYTMLTDANELGVDPEAEQLFSNMADLASLENGVLGFLLNAGAQPLDNLIEPGHYWAESLNPIFQEVDQGYVLIVGETEIVASHYAGEDHFTTYIGIPDHVHDSDLWYADTYGQTARPELVVGRVIGNITKNLNEYLENAIAAARGEEGYGFHRSRAYVSNGNGDGEWTFQDDANQVDNQLDVRYDESTWRNFIGEDGDEQRAIHQSLMPDRDLILYRGHGNEDGWDDGFSTGYANFVDGSTNPAMLAAACTTGNYETGDDFNLAERLLYFGAGAYVGATEKSERWSNSDAFVRFIPRWQEDESMGQALNQTKRKVWSMDDLYDNRKLWAFEYNLYGDPKYGRMGTLTAAADASRDDSLSVEATPQGLKLKVSLPALEVRRVDRYHSVRIPDGGTFAELDTYPIPVWTLSLDFPAGRQVQDVVLLDRGSQVATSNLRLPVVEAAIDCACSAEELEAPVGRPPAGWFPHMDQILDWSVEKQPNGSSTLEILLYPFYYNGTTGDAVYYRTYGLAVETLDSLVRVESFQASPGPHEPGDPVHLQLVVSNSSELRPPDVIVQASVRTLGTNKLLGGLPLQTLHALQGTATLDLIWDTRPYATGDYQIVVELLDTAGRLLDTGVAKVELGTLGARLTGLTANQEHFVPGDAIDLVMGVQNTGSVPIDGTAMFLVQPSEDLSTTQVITVPVSGLAPGASAKIPATWDTTGAQDLRYRVVGYVKFFSQTTEPRALILYQPRIFLPVVLRSH